MEATARFIAKIMMMSMGVHTYLQIHQVVCINYGQIFICLKIRSQRQRQGTSFFRRFGGREAGFKV